MTTRIGVHLRVTGHTSQGGRKYMEDCFSVAYQHTEDQSDLEYAYFGIFDGHGGSEAAFFAKNNLMDYIVSEKGFWSDNDEDVLQAIRNGFLKTHRKMWLIQDKWPKTASGLPSTAGTTASIAFVRHGKIFTGHVGDSGIILGYQEDDNSPWLALALTEDHKPESAAEKARIESSGGKVVIKSGVPRVVWNKPRISEGCSKGHKGPIRRNTPVDEIPFLAVARSLGDLWSYNPENDVFIVSPEPDVAVKRIDVNKFRCLLFGTDGLWNMLSPQNAVSLVQQAEVNNRAIHMNEKSRDEWINPSKKLVEEALLRWGNTRMRADNTTVVSLMLDPPGAPKRITSNKAIPILQPNSPVVTNISQKVAIISRESTECKVKEKEQLESQNNDAVVDIRENDNDVSNNLQKCEVKQRYSTPFENTDNYETMEEECSETNSKELEDERANNNKTDNSNSTTCIDIDDDDDEMNEDYNTFLLEFNPEHIKNVIFGELPNNYVCPKPTVSNGENINRDSATKKGQNKSGKLINYENEKEQVKNDEFYEAVNNTEFKENMTLSIKQNFEDTSESLSETIDETKTIDENNDEMESIQIHEISSSVHQDLIDENNAVSKKIVLSLRKRSLVSESQYSNKNQRKFDIYKVSTRTSKGNSKQNTKKRNGARVNMTVKKVLNQKYWYPVITLDENSVTKSLSSRSVIGTRNKKTSVNTETKEVNKTRSFLVTSETKTTKKNQQQKRKLRSK